MATTPIVFEELGGTPEIDDGARGQATIRIRGVASGYTAAELGGIGRGYIHLRQSRALVGEDVFEPSVGSAMIRIRQTLGQQSSGLPPQVGQGSIRIRARASGADSAGYGAIRIRGRGLSAPPNVVLDPPYIEENVVLLNDSVTLSGVLTALPGLLLRSAIRVQAKLKTKAQAVAALQDAVELEDRFDLILILMLKDAVTTGDTLSLDYTALIRLQDALLLSGTVTTVAEATLLMVEAVAFHATMEAMQFIGLSDQVTLSDVIRDAFTAAMQLVDSVLMTDTLTGTGTIAMALRDGVTLDGALLTSVQAVELLRDTVGLTVRFTLDDGHYVAWTMNADSKASSKYEQWPFNSYMRVGGRYYGVSDTGLYRLGGDTDDGAAINARVRMGMSTLGSRTAKHVPSVYLGYSATGDMLLKAVVADSQTGQRQAHVYRLHANDSAGSVREARTKLGRGLSAVYWDFEIVNDAGADFDIDVIEWMPLQTQRRLRGNAGGKK